MKRSTGFVVRSGIIALGAASLIAQVWAVPALVSRTVTAFPEAAGYASLAVGGGVLLIACVQVALIVVWHIAGLSVRGIAVSERGLPWVRTLAGVAVLLAGLSVVGALALESLDWTPVGVMLGLAGTAAVGGIGALALLAYVANYRREWRTN